MLSGIIESKKPMKLSEDSRIGLIIAGVLIGLIIVVWLVWLWIK